MPALSGCVAAEDSRRCLWVRVGGAYFAWCLTVVHPSCICARLPPSSATRCVRRVFCSNNNPVRGNVSLTIDGRGRQEAPEQVPWRPTRVLRYRCGAAHAQRAPPSTMPDNAVRSRNYMAAVCSTPSLNNDVVPLCPTEVDFEFLLRRPCMHGDCASTQRLCCKAKFFCLRKKSCPSPQLRTRSIRRSSLRAQIIVSGSLQFISTLDPLRPASPPASKAWYPLHLQGLVAGAVRLDALSDEAQTAMDLAASYRAPRPMVASPRTLLSVRDFMPCRTMWCYKRTGASLSFISWVFLCRLPRSLRSRPRRSAYRLWHAGPVTSAVLAGLRLPCWMLSLCAKQQP